MPEEKKVSKYVTVQSRREEIYEIFGRQPNAFEERALAELPLHEYGRLKVLNDSSMNGRRILELLEQSERNRDVSLLNEAGELLFMQAYSINAYLNPHAIGEGATKAEREAERARFAISNTSYLQELDPVKNPHTLEGMIHAEKTKLIPELTAHPENLVVRLLDPVRNPHAIDQPVIEPERVKFDGGVASHPKNLLSKLSYRSRNSYISGKASVESAGASFIAAGAPFSKKYHSAPPQFLTATGSSAFDLNRERGNLDGTELARRNIHLREEIAHRERQFDVRQGRDHQQREEHGSAPPIISHSPLSENLPNVTLYAKACPPTPELHLPPLNPLAQINNNSPDYNGWHQPQPEQHYPKTDPQAYSLSSGPADFKSFHTSALPMSTTQNNLNAYNVSTLPSITIAIDDAYLPFSYQSPGVPSTNHTTLHEFAARHPPLAGASKSHADSNSSQHIGSPLSISHMSQVHKNIPTTAVTISVSKPLPPRVKLSISSRYPGDHQSFSTESQDRMKLITQPLAQQSLNSAIPLNPPSDLSNALPAAKKRNICQYTEDGLKEVMKEAEDLTFKKAKTTLEMGEGWKAT